MNYIELPKLYYADKENYEVEYQRRFTSPDTTRLNFRVKGNNAFFVQNTEVSNLVFQILKTDKAITMLGSGLPGVAHDQFAKRCLIDEIVLTNRIEGVHSTRREIAAVLNDLEVTVRGSNKRKRFWGLVNQYYKLKSKEYAELKTCNDVRRLYDELVLYEVVEENPENTPDGELFRKGSTSIHSVTDKEIHRGLYPETAIVEGLEKALIFLNDESVEKLFRIAVFHYLLEYIHPFYDGNGRLGRFIVSNMLTQELNPLLAYRISYTITENINRYYKAFETCNATNNLGDLTPFLLMMLEMIKTSSLELEENLRALHARLAHYTGVLEKLTNGADNRSKEAYFILTQAGLFSEYGLSTKEYNDSLGCSYTTGRKELDAIDAKNLLTKRRIGRENYYMINLEALDAI